MRRSFLKPEKSKREQKREPQKLPGELARTLFRGTRSDEMPLKGSTAPSRIALLKVEQLEFQSFKKVNF